MSTFGNFTVSRAGTKTVTGPAGTPVVYGANEPAFEYNNDLSFRGVNTGDTDIWLADASTLIGQTEGTIYARVNLALSSIDAPILTLSNGSDQNKIQLDRTTDNRIRLTVITAGVSQASIQTGTGQSGELLIVVGYKVNDFVLYVNGAQIGTDSSGTIPATTHIGMGINVLEALYFGQVEEEFDDYDLNFNGGANMTDAFATLAVYKLRLSNTDISNIA